MSNANVTIPPVDPPAPPPAAPPAVVPVVAAPVAPVVPPAAAPTPAPPSAVTDPADPTWLKPRLERERLAGLRAAGFASEAEAKAAGDALKAKADADKTADQRAREATEALAAEKARVASLSGTMTEYAARMMVGLTPEQTAAVQSIAGDDPQKQVAAITALAPTWAKAQSDAAAAAAAAAPPPAAPLPSTTAPAAGAPGGVVPPPSDVKGQYAQIRSSNPFAAASFGNANPDVYTPKK